jgi:hypothetical protein
MGAKHTPGPWRSIIDDTGGQWSGWPLCITAENEDDKSVVRPGGQWPYEWDAEISQREAVANARLIASAPDLLEALRQLLGNAIIARHQLKNTEDASLVGSALWDTIGQAEEAIRKATGEAS